MVNIMTMSFFSTQLWIFIVKTHVDRCRKLHILSHTYVDVVVSNKLTKVNTKKYIFEDENYINYSFIKT